MISYDINARPSITGTGPEVVAAVERVVALADIVKASDEDLEALYPDRSITESAEALRALGPVAVVVTRGGEGALWVSEGSRGEIASVPVVVADTIGAGDTFGAAFIDELWTRGLVGASGRNALASLGEFGLARHLCVRRQGCRDHRVATRRRPAVQARALATHRLRLAIVRLRIDLAYDGTDFLGMGDPAWAAHGAG